MDIGGTLTKISLFVPEPVEFPSIVFKEPNETPKIIYQSNKEAKLALIKILTKDILILLEWFKEKGLDKYYKNICLAGGGSVRLNKVFVEYGYQIEKKDEILCLVKGINMLILTEEHKLFQWDTENKSKKYLRQPKEQIYPYLLVNIGSGVNIHIIKNKEGEKESLGGTSLGGGYFWGIARVLTRGKYSYEEILELEKKGDRSNIDLTVGDIYGNDYPSLGLPSSLTASSFGKASSFDEKQVSEAKDCDILASLLFISAQHISLYALSLAQLHNVTNLVFTGGLTNNNHSFYDYCNYVVTFRGKNKYSLYFVENDQFCGSFGCLL